MCECRIYTLGPLALVRPFGVPVYELVDGAIEALSAALRIDLGPLEESAVLALVLQDDLQREVAGSGLAHVEIVAISNVVSVESVNLGEYRYVMIFVCLSLPLKVKSPVLFPSCCCGCPSGQCCTSPCLRLWSGRTCPPSRTRIRLCGACHLRSSQHCPRPRS